MNEKATPEEMDQEIDQSEYRGATIYEAQGTYEFDSFVFTRFENLLLIATDVELVMDSIDASKGESYADTDKYDEIIRSLPKAFRFQPHKQFSRGSFRGVG
jgi:hypothetical protein